MTSCQGALNGALALQELLQLARLVHLPHDVRTADEFAWRAGELLDAIGWGGTNLGDTKPYAEDIPFTVWAANMPWAEKNRNALTAFARNYRRGVRWLYDGANKEQAIDILMKYARQARKDLEEAYDYQVTKLKLYGLDGDVSDKTYEKMAEGLVEIGFIKKPFPPKSAIFDGSFVQQATN